MSYLGVVTAISPGLRVRGDLSTTDDPAVNATGIILAVGARVVVDTVGKQIFVFGALDSPTRFVGEIIAGGWLVAPAGTLDCLGGSYLRATYPALFTAIGTAYGSVDGTHFNVPNFPVGTYLTGGTPGAASGAATHTLSVAEMPSHNHTQDPHNHSASASGWVGSSYNTFQYQSGGTNVPTGMTQASVSVGDRTAANNVTGGGGSFSLAPKSVGVRYVIKT